jgi:hypothetical protein
MLPPSWRASVDVSSSDICDKDREKCDDVRSISRMNTVVLDWFRPSYGVIAHIQFLLYYAIKFDAPDRLRAATFIVRRTPS